MKMTAKTTSPNTMPLRTLSAASTTNVVSTASTAPLIPICAVEPVDATYAVCGEGSALTEPVLSEPVLANRPQPASTEHPTTIPNPPTAGFWVATAIATITIPDCTASPATLSDLRPASSR